MGAPYYSKLRANERCVAFNRDFPVGTQALFRPVWGRDHGVPGRVIAEAFVMSSGDPVARVEEDTARGPRTILAHVDHIVRDVADTQDNETSVSGGGQ